MAPHKHVTLLGQAQMLSRTERRKVRSRKEKIEREKVKGGTMQQHAKLEAAAEATHMWPKNDSTTQFSSQNPSISSNSRPRKIVG